MEDRVLIRFQFEYNTAVMICCENKAIVEDELLLEFE